MALGDPFGITYEGARKGVSAFGEALTGIAEAYTGAKETEAEAQLKLEKEKAKIKAETPSFLESLVMAMNPQLAGMAQGGAPTGAAPTGEGVSAPVLGAPLGGGVNLGGALKQPAIDIPLSAGLKYDPLGMKQAEAQISLAEKEAGIPIEVSKQISAQKGKDILKATQNTVSATLKQNVVKRVWLDLLDQENKATGWKPGIGLGMLATVKGKMKWNDFYEAFQGTSNEYAAAVARIAMPNTRAIRAIQLFKAGKPTQFSTIESGVDNMRRTYENIITTEMSRNPEEYVPGFRNTEADRELLNAIVKRFGEMYSESMMKETYNKNPNLLKSETISKYRLDKELKEELTTKYGLE